MVKRFNFVYKVYATFFKLSFMHDLPHGSLASSSNLWKFLFYFIFWNQSEL